MMPSHNPQLPHLKIQSAVYHIQGIIDSLPSLQVIHLSNESVSLSYKETFFKGNRSTVSMTGIGCDHRNLLEPPAEITTQRTISLVQGGR